jgi:ribosomal protein L11 methyltransferase
VSVSVPVARLEQARAVMLELFPDGFEEAEEHDGVELVAYTDAGGEERLWSAFGGARSTDVDEGWEDAWRRFHRPVRAGPFWIGPPWEQPPPDVLVIVVDPGRAFGTGAHATTRLSLELLAELPREGLLDVGCGSGVLSIGAALLGFDPIVALDVDEQAREATERNAAANGVSIDVRVADAALAPLPELPLAIANVSLEVVERIAPRLESRLLVASGYLLGDEPRLPGWRRLERRDREGWAADLFERAG